MGFQGEFFYSLQRDTILFPITFETWQIFWIFKILILSKKSR